MAWRCSGSTNRALVENLQTHNIIKTLCVFETMLTVDRGNYAPSGPYEDSPQYIGFDATISAPHMHASALEQLAPFAKREKAKILDVGCGSGYLTVLFARLNPTATVLGVDYIPGLVVLSEANTKKKDKDLLTRGRVEYRLSSGWDLSTLSAPEMTLSEAFLPPYDVIHVGAAAAAIPQSLLDALKPGGRMIIPVGPDGGHQELLQVDRRPHPSDRTGGGREWGEREGEFHVESLMGVRYVPLVDR